MELSDIVTLVANSRESTIIADAFRRACNLVVQVAPKPDPDVWLSSRVVRSTTTGMMHQRTGAMDRVSFFGARHAFEQSPLPRLQRTCARD